MLKANPYKDEGYIRIDEAANVSGYSVSHLYLLCRTEWFQKVVRIKRLSKYIFLNRKDLENIKK